MVLLYMHKHSILCICYVAVVATIKTSMAWVHFHSNDTIQNAIPLDWQDTVRHSLGPKGFTGLVTVISYCSLSFVCQFNLLPVQKELQNPTKRRLNIIVIASIATAYVLYNIVIFMAYFNVSALLAECFVAAVVCALPWVEALCETPGILIGILITTVSMRSYSIYSHIGPSCSQAHLYQKKKLTRFYHLFQSKRLGQKAFMHGGRSLETKLYSHESV